MINLTLMRLPSPSTWMDGILLIDGNWFGYTLERPKVVNGRENVQGLCCIPPGDYLVEVTKSTAFGRDMPLVLDVPGPRLGIRFHGGNIVTDSRGCIMVASKKKSAGEISGSLEATLTDRIRTAGGAMLKIVEAA